MRPPFAKTRARVTWARTVNELARDLQCHVGLPVRDVRAGESRGDAHAQAHGLVSCSGVGALDAAGLGIVSGQEVQAAAGLADQGDRHNSGEQA